VLGQLMKMAQAMGKGKKGAQQRQAARKAPPPPPPPPPDPMKQMLAQLMQNLRGGATG
jgi:hypothetical protein